MSNFKLIDLSRLTRYNTAIQTWVKAVGDLANYYLKNETYSKSEVDNLISTIRTGAFKVVTTLPEPSVDVTGYIYLKKPTESATSYEEYICIQQGSGSTATYAWEKIGDTDIKLANYYTKSETESKIADAIAPFKTEAQIKAIIEAYDYATNTQMEEAIDTAVDTVTTGYTTAISQAISSEVSRADGKYYVKPTNGIPKTDLASAVKDSLELADTAVQDESYVHTDNNYTSADKSKLAGVESGAEVNVIEGVSVGGTDATIESKKAIIDLASNSDIDALFA